MVLPKKYFLHRQLFFPFRAVDPCSCRAAGCERTPRPASCEQFEGEVTGVYFPALALQVYKMPVLPSILIKMYVFNCFPPSTVFLLYPARREVKTDTKGSWRICSSGDGRAQSTSVPTEVRKLNLTCVFAGSLPGSEGTVNVRREHTFSSTFS